MAWATRPRGDQIPQIRYPRVISYRVNHSSNNTCMRQTDRTNFWLSALKFKTLPSNKGLFLHKDEHWDGHNKGDGFISHAADFLTSTWRKKGSWAGGRWKSKAGWLGRSWGQPTTTAYLWDVFYLKYCTWNSSPKLLQISSNSYPEELGKYLILHSSLPWSWLIICYMWEWCRHLHSY